MLASREEISAIERGDVAHDDSALAHAPHTAADLLVDDWPRAYTREQAAYPVSSLRQDKYWPPASRIDGGYRSEEHTSELQSLMRISYAVFCLKKKNHQDQKKQ